MRDTATADSWTASLPSNRSAGATWLRLGCGRGRSGGQGHPLCLGNFGPVLLQAEGTSTAKGGWPSGLVRGEELGQKSSRRASSHCSTSDPQHGFTYHGLFFFLFFPQNILQKKTEKGWRKTQMCWLPIHLPQVPLCMAQSSRIRQFHLILIYVFSPSRRYLTEHMVTIINFGWVFVLSHVLTFSHVAFKLLHWFQLSLVCKRINSTNTFQILSQRKTNSALAKSNYCADSSSTKQPQRFLLTSQLRSGAMLSPGLGPCRRLCFGGCKTWGGTRCGEGRSCNGPSSQEDLAAGRVNDLQVFLW